MCIRDRSHHRMYKARFATLRLSSLLHSLNYIRSYPELQYEVPHHLRACDIVLTAEEMAELEKAVAAIPVVGSRYDALQESKIQK